MSKPRSKSSRSNASLRKQTLLCAGKIEKTLRKSGLQLTMGGEPTFIPLQPEGDEWGTAALGPTKLLFARRFAAEFIRLFYPGALLTQTYGKWYPGEPLPRWSLVVHIHPRRKLWNHIGRLLTDEPVGLHDAASAPHFAGKLAAKLGLTDSLIEGANPDAPSIPVGYILPLKYDEGKWISDRWPDCAEHPLQLIPGDSSIGLRLPLKELPEGCLKFALTVEVKDQALEVFIPPMDLEPYLELMKILETLTVELDTRDLIISGYPPAKAGLIERYVFAADPGVIEINLPPSKSWSVYNRQLKMLYQAAHHTGLCAYKYHFNGRCAATGGGSHVCFGGPQPELSPVFLRPHFLPAILSYWQQHPSLSYLFSGQFVGPGSQAPRIDETSYDNLSELEVAFPGADKLVHNPELFGMLFRDLIADRTGNTHRAEISIDKLWNPFQPNGCIGIVEFRAFESQPDAYALSQVGLLLRGLMALLLLKPRPAVFHRWGTELHDRFFLPTLLWEDFKSVIADLQKAGYPFAVEWFRPHFEFRFPVIGTMPAGKSELCLRYAIEAWPLLGEQPSGSLTARSVDSSTERIELRLDSVKALDKGFLLVNGRHVPFKNDSGRILAALRYRAYHTVPSLHPHVPGQTPLCFEWISIKTGEVLSSVKWHSWQPNNQPYSSRPAHAAEANKRYTERWVPQPDRIGKKIAVPAKLKNLSPHFTTDLRRSPQKT